VCKRHLSSKLWATYVLDEVQKDDSLESDEFGEWLAVIYSWLESFVELEDGHDRDDCAEEGNDCDLNEVSTAAVPWHYVCIFKLTQMCAKYGLLDVAQYTPVASVTSVTTRRMSITTGNWKAPKVAAYERG